MTYPPEELSASVAAQPHAGRKRLAVALAIVLVPLIVGLVDIARHRWVPMLDLAIFNLRSRDVLHGRMPLTGAYSRAGWNHPGPALYLLSAPMAELTRWNPVMLRVGWMFLNAVVIALAVVLAARASRVMLSLAVGTSLLSMLALDPGVFRLPWNPYIPVPMLVLYLVFTMRVASGRRGDLVGVVLVGSVMIQAHIGTLLPVAALAVLASGFAVIDARRRHDGPLMLRTACVCLGVGAVIWSLPVFGAFAGVPGNLLTIVRITRDVHPVRLGVAGGARIMARQFAWRPPWLGGTDLWGPFPLRASLLWLTLPYVVLAVGLWSARRRADAFTFRLVLVAGVLLGTSILAVGFSDLAYTYLFAWRGVVGPFVVLVCALVLVRLLGANPGVLARRCSVAVGAAALVVLVVSASVHMLHDAPWNEVQQRAGQGIWDAVGAHPVAEQRSAVVRMGLVGLPSDFLQSAVLDALDAKGVQARIATGGRDRAVLRRIYGGARLGSVADADEVWTVVFGDLGIERAMQEPGARLVWRARPSRPMKVVLGDSLRRPVLESQLRQAGHPELITRLSGAPLPAGVRKVAAAQRRHSEQWQVVSEIAGFDWRTIPGFDWRSAEALVRRNESDWGDPCRCAIVVTPGGRATG